MANSELAFTWFAQPLTLCLDAVSLMASASIGMIENQRIHAGTATQTISSSGQRMQKASLVKSLKEGAQVSAQKSVTRMWLA